MHSPSDILESHIHSSYPRDTTLSANALLLANLASNMICITDKPVAMTEWMRIHRTDVETYCARKSSPEEESIIEKSIESHNENAEKHPQHGQNTKGSRIRRHSSYEPSLDDIKEEGHYDSIEEEKDLAAVHRERAFNSVSYKRKSEGRQFRKKMYNKSYTARPRAFTC